MYCIPPPSLPPYSIKEESHEIFLEILSAWEQCFFKYFDSLKNTPFLHISINFLTGNDSAFPSAILFNCSALVSED